MKPVDQEISHKSRGDCWSACLASILELDIDEVPKFVWHFGHYSDQACALWLGQRGFSYTRLERYIKSEDDEYFWNSTGFNLWHHEDTHCILTGKSPNFEGLYHAVVGRIGHGGKIEVAHDPSPHKKGILGAPVYLSLLSAKSPWELRKVARQPEGDIEFSI